ncbi:Kynurenine formamidase [Stieleria neptunia]|uniref:Kynurenine formamidase n=1 Tax=Stieleria neptunia TaxID=2527979 RepID=A0A518HQD2_9BACT|nr:cyclase family protein [Stieleria neptunia]QDV43062.1 Kynurenine formamidase [Stieleria neptunia]
MRILDLTLRLEKGMRGVDYETKYTVANDGWNARTLHLYSHCGTHMDSPYHFEAGEQTIDQIPISDCLGKAWVVALDGLADQTPITVEHLGPLADRVQPGDALLLRTLWSRHVADPDHYRDHFPPISPELARWMVARQVRMVGVEPPSVADVNDLAAVTEIHQILLGAGIIIVEGLTGLDQLTEPTCIFGAMPLKIAGGDGAPCRAFAILGATW